MLLEAELIELVAVAEGLLVEVVGLVELVAVALEEWELEPKPRKGTHLKRVATGFMAKKLTRWDYVRLWS